MTVTITEDDYKNEIIKPGKFKMNLCAQVNLETPTCTEVDLEIVDPCDPPVSIQRVVMQDQVYELKDTSEPSYTHPEFEITPIYCPITYSYSITNLQDGSTAFKKEPQNNDRTSVFEYTKDDLPISPVPQKQTVTVTATSTSKYGTNGVTRTDSGIFNLKFTDPCDNPDSSSIIATAQNASFSDNYSGNDINFTYNEYDVSPSWCQKTVNCDRIEPANSFIPCPELNDDGTTSWNFDEGDYQNVPPGTYTVIYKVCVDNQPDNCEELPVVIDLSDPCDPPNSITVPTLDDQDYVITDFKIPYTHPVFVADPSFCPVRYEYDVPALRNGNMLIEKKDGDRYFETYYD